MMRKCHLEPNKALICCHMSPLVQRETDVLERNTLFSGDGTKSFVYCVVFK